MRVFREKPGVVAEQAVWVCIYGDHLHINRSLILLIWEVIMEYRSDKHLAD
jgi:hypothetical protein